MLKPTGSYLLVSYLYLIRFSQAFGEVARPSDRCQRVDFTAQRLPMPSPEESEQDAGFGYKSPTKTENQSHGDSKVKSLPFHDAESESERLTCRCLRCCWLCKSIVVCQNQKPARSKASRPLALPGDSQLFHRVCRENIQHATQLVPI